MREVTLLSTRLHAVQFVIITPTHHGYTQDRKQEREKTFTRIVCDKDAATYLGDVHVQTEESFEMSEKWWLLTSLWTSRVWLDKPKGLKALAYCFVL